MSRRRNERTTNLNAEFPRIARHPVFVAVKVAGLRKQLTEMLDDADDPSVAVPITSPTRDLAAIRSMTQEAFNHTRDLFKGQRHGRFGLYGLAGLFGAFAASGVVLAVLGGVAVVGVPAIVTLLVGGTAASAVCMGFAKFNHDSELRHRDRAERFERRLAAVDAQIEASREVAATATVSDRSQRFAALTTAIKEGIGEYVEARVAYADDPRVAAALSEIVTPIGVSTDERLRAEIDGLADRYRTDPAFRGSVVQEFIAHERSLINGYGDDLAAPGPGSDPVASSPTLAEVGSLI